MEETNKYLEPPKELGCIEDEPDERDHPFGAVAGVPPTDMPTREAGYDVEEKFGKLIDDFQSSTLRCVTEGGTNDAEMTFRAGTNGKQTPHFSRKFVYPEIVADGGGAQPRDFYKFWKGTGLCEEELLPSFPVGIELSEAWARARTILTKQILDNAEKWKCDEYLSIGSDNIDLVRQAIFENAGCGGGYVGVNANMGHFVFFKGWGIHGGYFGYRVKDSYPPTDRWIIIKDGKWHLENQFGSEVRLFSLWTAKKNFPSEENMNVDKNLLDTLYNLIFHRDPDEGAKTHLDMDLNLVLHAFEESGEWKFWDGLIRFLKLMKKPFMIFGKKN